MRLGDKQAAAVEGSQVAGEDSRAAAGVGIPVVEVVDSPPVVVAVALGTAHSASREGFEGTLGSELVDKQPAREGKGDCGLYT